MPSGGSMIGAPGLGRGYPTSSGASYFRAREYAKWRLRWPARAQKLVLTIALDQVAEYYLAR
jgi:hypothetical protein